MARGRCAVKVVGQSLKLTKDPLITDRAQLLAQLERTEEFDLVIIGGGATGLGVQVETARREEYRKRGFHRPAGLPLRTRLA